MTDRTKPTPNVPARNFDPAANHAPPREPWNSLLHGGAVQTSEIQMAGPRATFYDNEVKKPAGMSPSTGKAKTANSRWK